MSNLIVYSELLKIMEQQAEMIVKLVNENAELENMIEVLNKEFMSE